MYENKFPISLTIPTDIKDFEIVYWLRNFTVDTMKTRYQMTYPKASVYLQRIVPPANRKAMDELARRALSFEITDVNIAEVQRMFEEADNWFTADVKKELFGKTDEGVLIFNMEYQNLKLLVVDESGSSRTALQLVPIAYQVSYENYEPGVVMYINKKENAVSMTERQFKRLSNFIQNFNFVAYTQYIVTLFEHARATGNVIPYEMYVRRLSGAQAYNSNLKSY